MSRLSTVIGLLLVGCSSGGINEPVGPPIVPGLPGVGQGGAQDFGRFRQILDEGGIPGPDTLDDVGFFAEHKFELPAPQCGEDVCIHGLYGAMDNMIDGSVCTVVLVGMNTTLTPESVVRPPLDLTVVVDTSGSMSGQPIADVRRGLTDMLAALQPEDRLSIVSFGTDAEVRVERTSVESPELELAIQALDIAGSTNLYAGLRAGYELAAATLQPERQNRLLLLSDGVATVGIEEGDRIVALADAYQEQGLSLSTIGLGDSFDVPLLRELAEEGAGAFYFVEDSAALTEVFTEEANVFLVPLAEQAEITLAPESNWQVRGVYGTRLFMFDRAVADIEVPSLQIAGRTDEPDEAPPTRRGGGGGIVIELLPERQGLDLSGTVGTLDLAYRVPGTEEVVEQSVVIEGPGTFVDGDRWFEGGTAEKGFVTLNIYVGFRMATESAARGDDGAALGVLDAVAVNVAEWLQNNPDSDILDDLAYVDKFRDNLIARTPEPRTPPENRPPWPQD